LSLGGHVENIFYLKDFVTWQVCEMLSDVSLGGVFMLLMQLPRWSPCRECLLFKRLRDMVLVSGQNEVLLLLLSLFDVKKQCFVSRAVTDVRRHVLNVFYLKDFVTWCLYQGRMRFF